MTIPANGMSSRRDRFVRRTVAATFLLLVAACSTDKILKVERPDIIDPNALGNTNGANALYAGVIGDMSQMYDARLGLNASSGLMTDELRFGATPPEVRQMDQRAAPESNTLLATVYRNVQQLRGQADRGAAALKALKATDPRVGEMQAISGLAHVLLAEHFCSGVPLSTPGVDGDPLTTTAVLQAGLAKLTEAATSTDQRTQRLAAVVRGRALVDLGQFDAAATAVASVPTSFEYTTFHSVATDYQKNGYSDYMFNFDGILVSDREGTNGLNFATAGDSRVPIEGTGGPSRFDGTTPRYYLSSRNSLSSPAMVASGVEARLIEAEAALRSGNTGTWLTKLNEARAKFGLVPLADPGSQTARVDLMFRERAFALFGTSHRLGDLRRLVRQYGRGAETVFPTGAYHKDGLTMGPDVQFIIPQTEKNNPKFTGCLDRLA
ncbi:MAG: RagB/SusD family nutrient uptake outer membrane protein [Gemmatimonadaceae bacterium]